jgi:hypothetical protein
MSTFAMVFAMLILLAAWLVTSLRVLFRTGGRGNVSVLILCLLFILLFGVGRGADVCGMLLSFLPVFVFEIRHGADVSDITLSVLILVFLLILLPSLCLSY